MSMKTLYFSPSPQILERLVYMWVVLRVLKVDNLTYIVQSTVEHERNHRVSWQDNPQRVKDLVLKPADLTHGLTVLVSWHIVTGFVQVIPAQVVEVVDIDYLWVKPDDNISKGCVRVHIDNICRTTHPNQTLTKI